MQRAKMELLAPAGDMQCLKMAVECGADAVYVGCRSFSARAGATNLDPSQLPEAAAYCHLRGAKLYLTLNTIVLDRELPQVAELARTAYAAGVDAVIVQDVGMAALLRRTVPGLRLHASTQMTLHSAGGVLQAQQLGFSRVVLARELPAAQIRDIARASGAELEVFVHGALCVCYSGQCLMSSFLGGRSANRGRCAQPCRLPYSAGTHRDRTLLSLKDACLLPHLQELAEAGVTSLKIEGRMKGPSYVGQVTSIYRKYLDSAAPPSPEDMQALRSAFDRGGDTDGYLTDRTGRRMFCFDKPENPYLRQKDFPMPQKKIPIEMGYSVKVGEPVRLWAQDDAGHRVEVVSDFAVERAQNAPTAEARVREQLQKTGETVYRCAALSGTYESGAFLPVSALNGLRRSLLQQLDQDRTEVIRRSPNAALLCPDDLTLCSASMPPGSELDALVSATDSTMSVAESVPYFSAGSGLSASAPEAPAQKWTVEVSTAEQLEALLPLRFSRYYVPIHLLQCLEPDLQARLLQREVFAVLPRVASDDELYRIRTALERLGVARVSVGNLGHIALFSEYTVHGEPGLNIINTQSLCAYADIGLQSAALSYEAGLRTANALMRVMPVECVVYGRIPLMVTENCLIRSASGCRKGQNCALELRDRKGASFPVRPADGGCRSEVLNAVPLYLADRPDDLQALRADFLRLKFTDESPALCATIARRYQSRCAAADGAEPAMQFTRGYFYKTLE